MQNNDKQLRAGSLGEELTKKYLTKLDDSFIRVNSKRVILGRKSQSAEFDHIVIGPSGVFIIDSKHWSGQIKFTNPGITQIKPNGEVRRYGADKDPTSQIEHQVYVMQQLLNRIGIAARIEGIMCFTNDNCELVNELPKFKALKLDELLNYITEKSQLEVLSVYDRNKILNALDEYSRDSETYKDYNAHTSQSHSFTDILSTSLRLKRAFQIIAVIVFAFLLVSTMFQHYENKKKIQQQIDSMQKKWGGSIDISAYKSDFESNPLHVYNPKNAGDFTLPSQEGRAILQAIAEGTISEDQGVAKLRSILKPLLEKYYPKIKADKLSKEEVEATFFLHSDLRYGLMALNYFVFSQESDLEELLFFDASNVGPGLFKDYTNINKVKMDLIDIMVKGPFAE